MPLLCDIATAATNNLRAAIDATDEELTAQGTVAAPLRSC